MFVILSLVIAACQPAAVQPTAAPETQSQPTVAEKPTELKPTVAKPTEAKPATTEEKITLNIWDTGTEYYQWVEDIAIPLFKESHPNVEIVHTGVPYDQFALKIDTAATAGDLPDLIADEVPGPNSKWYKAGLFIPLNPYMATNGINQGDFCGLINTTATLEGQQMPNSSALCSQRLLTPKV
jgi:ABC-type glycerol-3-phosphate transport system substrate-binding protein